LKNGGGFGGERSGEIMALEGADRYFPALDVEVVHQPAPGHMQVHRPGMAVLEGPEAVDLPKLLPAGTVEYPVARPAPPEIDIPLGVFPGREPRFTVR